MRQQQKHFEFRFWFENVQFSAGSLISLHFTSYFFACYSLIQLFVWQFDNYLHGLDHWTHAQTLLESLEFLLLLFLGLSHLFETHKFPLHHVVWAVFLWCVSPKFCQKPALCTDRSFQFAFRKFIEEIYRNLSPFDMPSEILFTLFHFSQSNPITSKLRKKNEWEWQIMMKKKKNGQSITYVWSKSERACVFVRNDELKKNNQIRKQSQFRLLHIFLGLKLNTALTKSNSKIKTVWYDYHHFHPLKLSIFQYKKSWPAMDLVFLWF